MTTDKTPCIQCGQIFTSRNQLFKHLNDYGHGTTLGGEDNNPNVDGDSDGNTTSADNPQLSKGNEAFFEYYARQKICDKQVWENAYQALRSPLPTTFRIHESSSIGSDFTSQLLSLVEKEVTSSDNERMKFHHWAFNGDSAPKLRMTTTPHFHRRNKNKTRHYDIGRDIYSPLLHALQELGAIHRQELVR